MDFSFFQPTHLVKSMSKLLSAADEKRISGDEERAFVFYMKYIECFNLLRESKDYKNDQK